MPADTTSTFASLRVRAYRLLFVSGTISFLAVQGQVVARGWLANDLTDSNAGLGGVYMAFGVPMLLATPFGGVLADRISKRLILIATQATLGVSALWIGLAVSFGFVEYWMLLVASAIQAISFAFLGPARMAMTSESVGRDLLSNAIVLGQMSLNSTRVLGPALAGVAIGIVWIGTSGVYYVSAALSFVALLAVLPLSSTGSSRSLQMSASSEFRNGLRYVREHQSIALLITTSFFVVMIGYPYLAFLPRVATDVFDVGAAGYGVMSAAAAVGAVGVSLLIAGQGTGRAAWKIQTVSGVAFGAGIVLLSIAPTYATALAAMFVAGAAASGFQSMNNSLVLALSDFEYHGRIQSLMMLSFSGFGMAALPLGALADAFGLRETLFGMGLVVFLTMAVYVAINRRIRRALSTEYALV